MALTQIKGSIVGTVTELKVVGGINSPAVTGSTWPNNIAIQPGASGNPSNGGYGAGAGIVGGISENIGGAVYLTGGYGLSVGGSVRITAGDANTGGLGGYTEFGTHDPDLYVCRLRILANGAWAVGTEFTDTGLAGQVLTSNGLTSPPTWQTVASPASSGFETTFLLMGA